MKDISIATEIMQSLGAGFSERQSNQNVFWKQQPTRRTSWKLVGNPVWQLVSN